MIQLSFLVPARHPWLLLAYPTSLWVKKTPTKGRGYKYPLSRQNRRGRGGWFCRLDKEWATAKSRIYYAVQTGV